MSTNVASVVSFFPDCENGFQTTLASTISSGATTVPLNSIAGYTNGLPAVFIVDPSDPLKKQTFTGIVDTGGVQLTSVVWTAGTNQTHTAGSTVGDYATATHIAMMSKGITVEHKQTGAHAAITADSVTVATGKITTSAVGKLEDRGIPLDTYRAGMIFDYVVSGGVWTADSVGVNLNASMTAIIVMINGQLLNSTNSPGLAVVTARAFTTNVDTYIDVLNTAGVGTLVYTTAATNAASPALAANSIRIGIIQAAATITAATKVNQGQEDRVFPIASSIPYAVTDSLGNLICPRDPSRRVLGYRQAIVGNTATTPYGTVPQLSCPVIVPTGRKIKITSWSRSISTSAGAGTAVYAGIHESTTLLAEQASTTPAANYALQCNPEYITSPTAGLHTYLGKIKTDSGTVSITGDPTYPNFIKVELM